MLRWTVAVLALSLIVPSALQAQAEVEAPPARDAVYAELLGNGLLYSVNYDRRFTDSFTGRVGLGVYGVVAAPVIANYLLGKGNGRLELGAGVVLFGASDVDVTAEVDLEDEEGETDWLLGTATIGYRYQPPSGGLVFRIGLTPFLSTSGGLPWLGMSLGYAFR